MSVPHPDPAHQPGNGHIRRLQRRPGDRRNRRRRRPPRCPPAPTRPTASGPPRAGRTRRAPATRSRPSTAAGSESRRRPPRPPLGFARRHAATADRLGADQVGAAAAGRPVVALGRAAAAAGRADRAADQVTLPETAEQLIQLLVDNQKAAEALSGPRTRPSASRSNAYSPRVDRGLPQGQPNVSGVDPHRDAQARRAACVWTEDPPPEPLPYVLFKDVVPDLEVRDSSRACSPTGP